MPRPTFGAMMEEIARIAPDDAPALQRYMDENRQKLAHFKPVLESAFESVMDFVKPEVMKSIFMLRPQLSIDGDLRRYFADDRVRQAFSFQAKYLGMSPFNCPSLFTILAFLEYEYGVYHPIGGCGAVMDKMAELATRMGVKIKLSEGVESIDFDGKRARSAITAKGRYECDSMVINADFRPDHENPGAQPDPQALDRQVHQEEEIFLLHIHDVSGHQGALRRPAPPHDLPVGRPARQY